MIVQAVHHTFYPLVEAPDSADIAEGFLVLIIAGQLKADVVQGFALCRPENWNSVGR